MFKGILYIVIVFVCLILNTQKSYSQTITPENLEKLQIMEDSLVTTSDSMYDAFIPDLRIGYSERFIKQLVHALKIPNSYLYPFNKLKDKINIIYADDTMFRIINWCIVPAESAIRYYGAIQLQDENLKLYGLVDCSQQLGKTKTDTILKNGRWFGALYYRIMGLDVDGKRIYTLFGYNSAGEISNYKVLDPLILDEHGPTFGAPIFGYPSENYPKRRVNRFILEYKKDVQVSMNWDAERHAIVFDYLTSMINDPNRKYTYVPTGEYDGFRWGNNIWNYIRNLIPITILQDGQAPGGEDQK